MVKISDDDLQKEIKKQDQDFGDFDDIDPDDLRNTEDTLEKVIGNPVDPEEDGFSIAEEVDKDEEDIEEGSDNEKDEDLMSIEDMAEEEDAFNDEDL